MFVGRQPELLALEASLLQTRVGRPKNFMITGERGIGKTSLLDYIRYVAGGKIKCHTTAESLRYLIISADIEPGTTQETLIRRIERELHRRLSESEKARTFMRDAWSFIQRLDAGGLSISAAAREDPEVARDEFAYSIARTVERVTGDDASSLFGSQYEAVLLLMDECDKGSSALELGALLKLLLERVQRHGCSKFMVGLAGLDNLRDVLHASHESSLRIFDEIKLGRLRNSEVEDAITICLKDANEQNTMKTTVDEGGTARLLSLSEGYPHFIQQLGYCAFEQDDDGVITEDDVMHGAVGTGGAIELIGDRYYREGFYHKIQEESYRRVLRIMAEELDGWVTKAEIRARFSGKTTTLDNAIHALRTRGIIQSKEGERGVYRLQHRAFAYWIKLFTVDPAELEAGRQFGDE